jgi:hypothetical protein
VRSSKTYIDPTGSDGGREIWYVRTLKKTLQKLVVAWLALGLGSSGRGSASTYAGFIGGM